MLVSKAVGPLGSGVSLEEVVFWEWPGSSVLTSCLLSVTPEEANRPTSTFCHCQHDEPHHTKLSAIANPTSLLVPTMRYLSSIW